MMEINKEKLGSIFTRYTDIPVDVLYTVIDSCAFMEMEKGTVFSSEGKKEHNEYFVITGVAREFVVDAKGNDVTINFYLPCSVITPHFVRSVNGKSLLNIQAITACTIAYIDAAAFTRLRDKYEPVMKFGDAVVNEVVRRQLNKEIDHSIHDSSERLVILRKNFSGIENMIPHPYIASYLGITNVSLSRLRKQLAKK